ncbi:MAG: YraN family protein [Desulfobacterales bacterium]|nr:YraN family protein [Desulfobacterales bacterium]MDJ0855286.1 YraN family protein [Desulfobacterales bacterium]MDJ0886081.1 YraN family protein [Desulfobacterales bacterium]
MLNLSQRFGQKAEDLAARHLKRRGYKILTRNYRTRAGEIDIIAREGKSLVFIEVKGRQSTRYGSAKAAVTPRKQRQVAKVALWYLKETDQMDAKARFDVVAVTQTGADARIEIVRNAFQISPAAIG